MAEELGSWWSKDTIAVVTGANKGIGYEIVRELAQKGLTVVLTARDPAKGQAAVDALKTESLDSVVFHPLEVSSAESVEKLAIWLKKEFGGIDILVNNAGLLSHTLNYEAAKDLLGTNYFGLKNVIKGLLPLLRASPNAARIVNVSSRLGLYERLQGESLKQKFRDEDNLSEELVDSLAAKYLEDVKFGRTSDEGWIAADKSPVYSESKIFVNAYGAALAKSLSKSQPQDHQIISTTFCPGIVATDMFKSSAELGFVTPEGITVKTPAGGADTGVWLALLPKEELLKKHGKFFAEREEVASNTVLPF